MEAFLVFGRGRNLVWLSLSNGLPRLLLSRSLALLPLARRADSLLSRSHPVLRVEISTSLGFKGSTERAVEACFFRRSSLALRSSNASVFARCQTGVDRELVVVRSDDGVSGRVWFGSWIMSSSNFLPNVKLDQLGRSSDRLELESPRLPPSLSSPADADIHLSPGLPRQTSAQELENTSPRSFFLFLSFRNLHWPSVRRVRSSVG